MISSVLTGYGQENNDDWSLDLETSFENNEVRLKWTPRNQDMWEWGLANGYTITRKTISSNGVELTTIESLESEVVVGDNISALTENEIDIQYPDNKYAQVVKGLLYSPDINDASIGDPNSSKMADALESASAKELQHSYGTLVGDLDFEAAICMGLGFVDATAMIDHEYVYSVSYKVQPSKELEVIAFDDFEDGWGNWIAGGGANSRIYNRTYPHSGEGTLMLRNGSGSSHYTSHNLPLAGAEKVKFSYSFTQYHLANGHKLEIQISFDGGNSFSTLKVYEKGVDFNNSLDKVQDEVLIDSNELNNQTRLRLRSYFSVNTDYVMFDDLKIEKSVDGVNFYSIYEDNIELNYSTWIDGGTHASIRYDNRSTSGVHANFIRRNAFTTSQKMALAGHKKIEFSFDAMALLLENGSVFDLLVDFEGNGQYELVKQYECGVDFIVGSKFHKSEIIKSFNFTDQTSFRFQMYETVNTRSVSIDNISIKAIDNESNFSRLLVESNFDSQGFHDNWSNPSIINEIYVYDGTGAAFVRYNGNNSILTSDNLSLAGEEKLKIKYNAFNLRADTGEYYEVQVSYDGGQSFETVKTNVIGETVRTGSGRIYDDIVVSSPNLNNQTQVRFKSYFSDKNEYLIIDNLEISSSGPNVPGIFDVVDYNDFENGLGIWNKASYSNIYNRNFVQSGKRSIQIKETGSSTIALPTTDLKYLQFQAKVRPASLEDPDYFAFQIAESPSAEFKTIKTFGAGEYPNGKVSDINAIVPVTIQSDDAQFRIKMFGSDLGDYITLDDIKIHGLYGLTNAVSYINTNDGGLPDIDLLSTIGSPLKVTLKWDNLGLNRAYSSYEIERSIDGTNFTKIHDDPYVYFTSTPEEPIHAFYQDELDDNETVYYYRVRGKSEFGNFGPYSQVLEGKGRRERLDLNLRIDSFYHTANNDNNYLLWNPIDPMHESEFAGMDIYRSDFHTGPFEKITETPIAINSDSYVDIDPLSIGYYKLVAVDDEDYSYESVPIMAQLEDATPPPVPEITNVEFISDEKVLIEWDHVFAEDFEGYRVFFANGERGSFLQLSPGGELIKENFYEAEIETGMQKDSLIIKVVSVDLRDNQSQYSESKGTEKPDLWAPNAPHIGAVNALPDGVRLGFTYSSSSDVIYHVIERRIAEGPTWSELVKITPEEQDDFLDDDGKFVYIDDSYIEIQEYEYRIRAEDNNYNKVSSNKMTVTPATQLVKGFISNLGIELQLEVSGNPPEIQNTVNQLITMGYDVTETNESANVKLTWNYTLDPNLKEFKIYRSMTGGNMVDYKIVSLGEALGNPGTDVVVTENKGIQSFQFTDLGLMQNRTYTYELQAIHKDLSESNISSQVSMYVPQ